MSPGPAHRLWRAAGLQVPRKRPKKRVSTVRRDRERRAVLTRSGPTTSCPIIAPTASSSSASPSRTSSPRKDWPSMSAAAFAPRASSRCRPGSSYTGTPMFLRSDNGPRSSCRRGCCPGLLSWIVAHGIGTALIEPGKPWQNGFPDSGRPIRPSQHIEMSACFPSSSHRGRTHAGQTGGARDKILPVLRSRGRYVVALYNHVRPHSSLDYLTRTEFVARGARSAPRQATDLDAAVHGTSAPQPIAEPSRRGQMQPAREAVSS